MTDRESSSGRNKPLDERIKERAKELIRDIVAGLESLVAPAPQPVPVRMRPRPRRR